jgi:hypothetical protein
MNKVASFLIAFIAIAHFCLAQNSGERVDSSKREMMYKMAITKGDSCFAAKEFIGRNYSTAISYYEFALRQKPNEQYPKDRICEAFVFMPYHGICPFVRDTDEFLRRKVGFNIASGDSAFFKENYSLAKWYYDGYFVLNDYKSGRPNFYVIKQLRSCDSVLHNDALKEFETSAADSLLSIKDYYNAASLYKAQFLYLSGIGEYIVDTSRLRAQKLYLEKQISACNKHTNFDQFRFALRNEECDGPSSRCHALALVAAEKAEEMGDYATAAEFYGWAGDSYTAGKMNAKLKELKENKK